VQNGHAQFESGTMPSITTPLLHLLFHCCTRERITVPFQSKHRLPLVGTQDAGPKGTLLLHLCTPTYEAYNMHSQHLHTSPPQRKRASAVLCSAPTCAPRRPQSRAIKLLATTTQPILRSLPPSYRWPLGPSCRTAYPDAHTNIPSPGCSQPCEADAP
jgi:hypothetical protein